MNYAWHVQDILVCCGEYFLHLLLHLGLHQHYLSSKSKQSQQPLGIRFCCVKYSQLLSTDLAWGFVQNFLELNEGTERTWLQLIRSCALHLLRCPNFKKVKGLEVGSGLIGNPKGIEDKGASWRLTWLIFELLNTNEVTKLLY